MKYKSNTEIAECLDCFSSFEKTGMNHKRCKECSHKRKLGLLRETYNLTYQKKPVKDKQRVIIFSNRLYTPSVKIEGNKIIINYKAK